MTKIKVCVVYSILLVCTVILSGCNKSSVHRTLSEMMQEKIIFPNKLLVIDEESRDSIEVVSDKAKMVIWIDSLQCSSCIIKRLHNYENLYKLSSQCGTFDLMILFSPRRSDCSSLAHVLEINKFPFPIYIDVENTFSVNNSIPDNPRFHGFLVGNDKRPIFVGDPTYSRKLMSLFVAIVDTV